MSKTLLNLEGISARVGQKRLLNDINLTINEGELHILMGPNGAGKSTLGNVVMGYPVYTVDSGSIKFLNEDITEMATEKRAKLGLF
ncbi:MAG: ATP-binding cassette domain-containing protein, partial [Sphaerochaetaceae bacterium]